MGLVDVEDLELFIQSEVSTTVGELNERMSGETVVEQRKMKPKDYIESVADGCFEF